MTNWKAVTVALGLALGWIVGIRRSRSDPLPTRRRRSR